jgi:hypothetical protein
MPEQAAVEIAQEPKRKHASKSPQATAVRCAKLVNAVIQGESLRDTAIECGLSPKTAGSQASDLLKRPEAQATFLRILEERGLTDAHLAGKLSGLMDAKHTIYSQWKGKFTDSKDVDALETQRKTLETVLKLKGHLREDHAGGSIEIGLMQMVVQVVRDSSETP